MKKWYCLWIGLAMMQVCLAQQNSLVQFIPVLQSKPLMLDSIYQLSEQHTLQISTFKFYISNIVLYKEGKLVYQEKNNYYLLNYEQAQTMQLKFTSTPKSDYDEIRFNLGLDSITNVSGAMGGDLDPTKGMYWTWQNGYINVKLEGTSNLSTARKNEFQFHLGGYLQPHISLQNIRVSLKPQSAIRIAVDLNHFLEGIDFARQHHLMLPGQEAVRLSKLLAESFYIQAK